MPITSRRDSHAASTQQDSRRSQTSAATCEGADALTLPLGHKSRRALCIRVVAYVAACSSAFRRSLSLFRSAIVLSAVRLRALLSLQTRLFVPAPLNSSVARNFSLRLSPLAASTGSFAGGAVLPSTAQGTVFRAFCVFGPACSMSHWRFTQSHISILHQRQTGGPSLTHFHSLRQHMFRSAGRPDHCMRPTYLPPSSLRQIFG